MADDELTPPSLDDLEAMARRAYDSIPTHLRQHAKDVVVRVVDFPDDETLDDLGLDTPFDLLGLYRGVSLDKKEGALIDDVDMVFLYRRPILDYWCETGEPLARIVTHVLIHEIGHHFGFSDADMEAIEAGL